MELGVGKCLQCGLRNVVGGICVMENNLNQSKPLFEEAVLARLDDVKQAINDLRKDLHIQVLSSNTKMEHTNNVTNALLNGFSEKVNDLVKALEEIKKSSK
jgi:hypothetical protein